MLRFPAAQSQLDAFPKTLPGLRGSHILDGAGHWIQQERPDEVNRLLIEFLEGLAGLIESSSSYLPQLRKTGRRMALNIKDRDTEEVVRRLAQRTGLSITDAVQQAATEKLRGMDRLCRHRRMTPNSATLRKLEEISKRAAALPILRRSHTDG